ncbi:hypothetical protein [Porphyromonas endodontalis]|uniref:hypothetical protein n=1 Tax=Porphyromonas endodontalis TaxID=28124 RepID=UPI0028EAA977|nr:hypothetical protein [Porphyromonas endodontalis]
MKKKMLCMGAFLCGVIFFLFSCSKKEEQNALLQDVQGLEMQFDAWRELASYHSLALENIYLSLKDTAPSDKSFVEGVDEDKMELALKFFLEKEVSKDSFRKASRALTLTSVEGQLRSAEATADVVDEKKVGAFFDDFCSSIEKIEGPCDLKEKIKGALRNPKLFQMNPTEQKVVLMRLSIYEDSFLYWKDNYRKWVLPEENLRSSSLRDGGWSDFWEKVKEVAKADAEGPDPSDVIAGGVGGAAGGALVGAFTPIGPGSGAVTGGVGTATTVLLAGAVKASYNVVIGGGGTGGAGNTPGGNGGSGTGGAGNTPGGNGGGGTGGAGNTPGGSGGSSSKK